MTNANRHRLQLPIYLILVAVVVLALFGYQRHTNSRLDKVDRISCQNRKTLLDNQRLELIYLHTHATGIDLENGKLWMVEFAERIPSTEPPRCK